MTTLSRLTCAGQSWGATSPMSRASPTPRKPLSSLKIRISPTNWAWSSSGSIGLAWAAPHLSPSSRPAFPRFPVLVLGRGREESAFYQGPNVRFLPRTASSDQMIAAQPADAGAGQRPRSLTRNKSAPNPTYIVILGSARRHLQLGCRLHQTCEPNHSARA